MRAVLLSGDADPLKENHQRSAVFDEFLKCYRDILFKQAGSQDRLPVFVCTNAHNAKQCRLWGSAM